MKYYLKLILVLLACWSMTSVAISQETLEEKKARADGLFQDKNWGEAEGLYASIISNSPKNHDLNFRYGTCLLFGSKNKEEAIKRLRYASTGPGVDKRAFYYLGQAYHLNYQFNDAIKHYKRFKELASPNDLKEFDVDRDIKACNFGKKLLANVTNMVVLQKTELRAESFYDLYKLDDIGGTLLITDLFQSKLDRKREHRPIIHFPSNSPYIYYSSYGDDGTTGLDIYVKKKLPGGEWSLAQKVKGQINTDKDEDFAYMHPNGEYLYFSSKGHNSMGGYDVFRSRYNPNDQSFGPPENLDFAISSPDDDLLFVVDSLDRVAYFSSARESGQGNLTVYKVRVDRIPMQMAVIKGNFLNTIVADEKEVEIEIEDFSSGRIIGKFNSKKTNGDYLITFPKSGKYRYIITPEDSDVSHVYIVDIPYSKDFRPLKQSMTLKLDGGGEEFIEVTDRFNESFDDPVAIMAEVYRELSKLPPNAEDFNLDSLDALKETDEIFVDAGLDPFITNDGLEAIMVDEVEDLSNFKLEEEKQRNIAYNLGQEKSNLANEKMVELNNLIAEAEKVEDPNEKTKILESVIERKKEIQELNNEAQSLIELTESIETSIAEKAKLLKEAEAVLEKAKALPDGDRTALINLVKSNTDYFAENIKGSPENGNAVTLALQTGANEQKKVQSLSEEISALSKSKRELEKENRSLKDRQANEKKQKVKDEIQQEIDENDSEIGVLEANMAAKSKELDNALNNNESVRNGIAAAIVLKDDYANSEYEKELSESDKQKIKDNVRGNDLTESLAAVDDVLEKNNVSAFNIDLYANNEQTSSYSLEQWNDEIDKEKERLVQEKLVASEERKKQLEEEIERLEELRQDKMEELDVGTDDPVVVKPDVTEDEILSDYSQRKEGIETIVSEEDRRKATIDLNAELIREIEKEQKSLEKMLADNPKDKNVKARLENLDQIKNDIQNEISADEEWIASNQSNDTFDEENVLGDLDPNYQEKINAAFEIINEEERNTAIGDLNEIVLERSNERIQELQAVLTGDPENQKAKDELIYLQDFVKDLAENKYEPLMEPNTINVDELTADVSVNDLIRNYDSRKKVIDGIKDEYQRRTEENKLYKEVIDKARNELAQLDRLAEKNPDNKTIVKRQDALRDLDRDYNKSIEKNKDWLDKNKPTSIEYAKASTVKKAYPLYQTEVDRITKIADDGDREKAIEKLNGETSDKIVERVKELDAQIKEDPSNTVAQEEKEELEALKKQIKDNKGQLLLEPTSAESIVTNPGPTDLLADYEDREDEINQSNQTDIEKEETKIELNEELVALISAELDVVEKEIENNPELSEELTERKASLLELQSAKELEIDQSKQAIDNASAADSRPDISINSLMPDYEKDLAAIKGSNKSEKEQLEEENQLNQMLIAAIDYKLSKLDEEISEDPVLADAIEKEAAKLNQMKADSKAVIDANTARIDSGDASTDVAINDARPIISVGELMSDYESQLADIRNGSGTDPEKLERENNLHQELIDLTEEKIAALEKEKADNPEQVELIDKDIEKLKNIKRSTQNSININEDQLAQLGANKLDRPSISIGNLKPDFEDRMAAIDNSSATEIEKLEQKNELNNELLRTIENKLTNVQEEWEEDPNNGFTYNEEINKLEELKESKRSEIARNNDAIKELEGDEVAIADIKPTDYNTDEGKAAIADFDQEIVEINELNNDIEILKEEFNATEDEKDRAKIQKSIDKAENKKAELENEVIEGLEDVNKEEIKTVEEELQGDKELTSNSSDVAENGFEENVRTANENLIIAEQKLNEAKELRDQAEDEKDPIKANEELKEAFQLEQEAKELVNESRRIFRMARTVNNYAAEDEVIVEVPDNVSDRESTQLMDESADLRQRATAYYDRATELRDSSETVKKKYRDAVLGEADLVEVKGDQLNQASNDLEMRAEEIKEQEDEIIENRIDTVEKIVDEETTESVATSEPYKSYYAEKNEGDKKLEEAAAVDNEIKELKNTRARRFRMAVSGTADDPTDLLAEDEEIVNTQKKIDSLTAVQKELRDQALQNYQNAKNILDEQSDFDRDDIMALEQRNVVPFERKLPTNVDFEVPENLNADIFRTTDQAVYSEDTPIPVSAKQPSGLVYKVQVGAFRKALPQDHFKEFAPISGERLNNGITRYMVGYFTTFDPANEAKGKVNAIGYGDAFVVAYCNGERITVDKARQIEQGVIACEGTAEQDQNDNITIDATVDNTTNSTSDNTTGNTTDNTTDNITDNTTTNTTDNTTNNTVDNTSDNTTNNNTVSENMEDQSESLDIEATTDEERRLVDYYTSVPDAADANQVEIIQGLFYTVQIGVYSKPVPNSALFDIQPLNSQRTSGGYIRYSTGIYASEEAATVRKDEVVGIGVADAFVTAYFKGERITPDDALQLLIRDGAEILVGNEGNAANSNTESDATTGPLVKEEFFKEGLHYRILIGKYEDAIPGEYATLLLRGDDIFETEVDQEGRTVLVSGKIESYDEMIDRLSEFADLGIEDMDIVTYYKYDVIPFEEGEKIRKDEAIESLNPLTEMEGISANDYVYTKEAVYFNVKLGEFEDKIPSDFTNLLLLYEEEENINKEETINDETVFVTGNIESYQKAQDTRQRLLEKGFDRAIIVAFHKYDEISIEKAREILGE